MRVVMLAGGEGQRLRPYTAVLPKPLMPVGDRPIMDVIVRQLRHAGAARITVAIGRFKKHKICIAERDRIF